ncbi:MaoC/PaaZ C-terminal domain-containing protein [Blastococcus sp. SYSU DS0533]
MIDPAVAVAAPPRERAVRWTDRDVLLYHLGLGLGRDDPTDRDVLGYVTEGPGLRVLPSFWTLLPRLGATGPPRYDYPGVEVNPATVLHAFQEVGVTARLPTEGHGTSSTGIAEVWDKGADAVLVEELQIRAADGRLLVEARSGMFVRGAGGFGGPRGTSVAAPSPVRRPDVELFLPTDPAQALLYRLSGDRNPLHSDPDYARRAGFPRPILHGLCTYGMTCAALVGSMCGNDPDAVRRFGARFAGVVYPGETLRVRAWADGETVSAAVTVADRDDAPALGDVRLEMGSLSCAGTSEAGSGSGPPARGPRPAGRTRSSTATSEGVA